ncbi:MAG: hypothetical protein A2V77_16570 [Anaeromyxobacter sp. RBG_16_69_14]|nr:MAG: hypothetical protein A2V77_16570 [Anaeromyxobacter sp. RBG_16_69_14]
MNKVRILLTGGSFNQMTQMAQIAEALPAEHFETWFTRAYVDGPGNWCSRRGLLEWTVLGDRLSERGLAFLRDRGARIDDGGRANRPEAERRGTA